MNDSFSVTAQPIHATSESDVISVSTRLGVVTPGTPFTLSLLLRVWHPLPSLCVHATSLAFEGPLLCETDLVPRPILAGRYKGAFQHTVTLSLPAWTLATGYRPSAQLQLDTGIGSLPLATCQLEFERKIGTLHPPPTDAFDQRTPSMVVACEDVDMLPAGDFDQGQLTRHYRARLEHYLAKACPKASDLLNAASTIEGDCMVIGINTGDTNDGDGWQYADLVLFYYLFGIGRRGDYYARVRPDGRPILHGPDGADRLLLPDADFRNQLQVIDDGLKLGVAFLSGLALSLAQLNDGDTLIILLTGHGLEARGQPGHGSLCLGHDTSRSLTRTSVESAIREERSYRPGVTFGVLVISDACFGLTWASDLYELWAAAGDEASYANPLSNSKNARGACFGSALAAVLASEHGVLLRPRSGEARKGGAEKADKANEAGEWTLARRLAYPAKAFWRNLQIMGTRREASTPLSAHRHPPLALNDNAPPLAIALSQGPSPTSIYNLRLIPTSAPRSPRSDNDDVVGRSQMGGKPLGVIGRCDHLQVALPPSPSSSSMSSALSTSSLASTTSTCPTEVDAVVELTLAENQELHRLLAMPMLHDQHSLQFGHLFGAMEVVGRCERGTATPTERRELLIYLRARRNAQFAAADVAWDYYDTGVFHIEPDEATLDLVGVPGLMHRTQLREVLVGPYAALFHSMRAVTHRDQGQMSIYDWPCLWFLRQWEAAGWPEL